MEAVGSGEPRRPGWDRAKALVPWLALAVLLVVPLYALAISFVVRSGIFDLRDRTISDEEFRTLWAFIAAGVGTAATIIGFLLTRSHNERTLAFQRDLEDRKLASQQETDARMTLETVVRGLELLVVGDGAYAPRARIAGSLATMVQLGHPAIAMRVLATLWQEDKVDNGTACWLISEVLRMGTRQSRIEAAYLLYRHADSLTDSGAEAWFDWPDILQDNWSTDFPLEARLRILASFVMVVLSKEPSWWGSDWWFFPYLDEVAQTDPDPTVTDTAMQLLWAFHRALPPPAGFRVSWQSGWKSLDDIKGRMDRYVDRGSNLDQFRPLIEKIPRWAGSRRP
jgi:hypothetical protein